ncbi:AfsR/SARP family transcriptional regulator [Kitasatospora paranensis]|uniref:AfsR/SARP family transcriptional regulator n=1 Tax=Kitasatospora paranensis TaxID=258053 RepID=A0ABW2G866_9ACTN
MQINILGAVSAGPEGFEQTIPAQKVRTLLAVLALNVGRVVPHRALAEELWSDRPPVRLRNALQATVTRVRHVLEGPPCERGDGSVLRSVQHGYLLDLPRDRVDGTRFLDLCAQGSAAQRSGDPERALALLRAGLRLWRGPALFDAGDGLRCAAAAALFDERRLAAREDLAEALLTVGDVRQAVAELHPLVVDRPTHERLCELLMVALYRSGRQSEALTLYHRTRRRLDAELGLTPGADLQRRYLEILTQDPALTQGRPGVPVPVAAAG